VACPVTQAQVVSLVTQAQVVHPVIQVSRALVDQVSLVIRVQDYQVIQVRVAQVVSLDTQAFLASRATLVSLDTQAFLASRATQVSLALVDQVSLVIRVQEYQVIQAYQDSVVCLDIQAHQVSVVIPAEGRVLADLNQFFY
jgi:hypothetical protein